MLIFGVYAHVTQELGGRNRDDTIGAWYVLLVSFIMSPSVAALSHRRPASAGTSGDLSCCGAPINGTLYVNDIIAWAFSCIISVRCLWLS